MRYEIKTIIETEKELSTDIMECIAEDVPDAVAEVVADICGKCYVADCQIEKMGE